MNITLVAGGGIIITIAENAECDVHMVRVSKVWFSF